MIKNDFYILGFDIGGTKIAISLANSKGQIISSKRFSSGAKLDPYSIIAKMCSTAKNLLAQSAIPSNKVKTIGISAPGPLDIPKGLTLASPNLALWDRIPIIKEVENSLDIKTYLENDANAGVLAEWMFGAARGKQNIVYLTMSTGVGSGIIVNGRLIQGHSGQAGEIGHSVLDINGPSCGCGQKGCFEAYCGGRSVSKRLKKIVGDNINHPFLSIKGVDGDINKLSYKPIREAAVAGLPEAVEFWDEICMRLAQGLGQCMMSLNPEMIILGTLALYSGDILFKPLNKYIQKFAWPEMYEHCTITSSSLGSKIGEASGIAVGLYSI